MKKIIFTILALALFAVSCTKAPEFTEIYEVGFATDKISLQYNSGSFEVGMLSNGEYTVTIPSDCSWLSFSNGAKTITGNGDGSIRVFYTTNRSIPRTASIIASRASNSCSFTVSQEGLLEGGITVVDGSINVSPEGGEAGAKVNTKIEASKFSFETSYMEEAQTNWIGDVKIQNNFVAFTASPNFSEASRHARIYIKAEDSEANFLVSQYPVGSTLIEIDVDDLKAMATEEKTLIEGHYVLDGTVLNDWSEYNGAENIMISVDFPDYIHQNKVMYVQNEDGTSGMKFEFKEEISALVGRFSKASIDLDGLTLIKQSSPERYLIQETPLTAIISAKMSDAVQPRQLTIDQITAKDLYTFVKLPDVEIPVRKGCYAPFDIRKISVVTAYPTILRDTYGNSMYMMVNVDCPWSRDGRTMPRGRGAVQGVLVHESSDNFEWDTVVEKQKQAEGYISTYITGLGNIGDWQIRPVVNADIQISENFEESFSDVLYEWAYVDTVTVADKSHLIRNSDDLVYIYPSHSSLTGDTPIKPFEMDAKLYCNSVEGPSQMSLYNDWTHLGPYEFGGKITQPANGNGVVDDLGREAHYDPYASVSTTGVIFRNNGSCWAAKNWSVNQYWCCEFNASALNSSNAPVSVQFGVMNEFDQYGAPRYWNVEYSLDGSKWIKVIDYTIPDFVIPATMKVYQLPGPKYQTANLPDAVIGQEKVYVRLIPTSTKAGNSTSYDSGAVSTSRYSAMNYFAVRYNK